EVRQSINTVIHTDSGALLSLHVAYACSHMSPEGSVPASRREPERSSILSDPASSGGTKLVSAGRVGSGTRRETSVSPEVDGDAGIAESVSNDVVAVPESSSPLPSTILFGLHPTAANADHPTTAANAARLTTGANAARLTTGANAARLTTAPKPHTTSLVLLCSF